MQPEQAIDAQAVSTRLMLELTGARLVPGTIDVGGEAPPPKTIALRDARISRLLGVDVPRERSAEILKALGFKVASAHDGLEVTVPSFRRADVTREVDLIEEVARLDGLEKLPVTLPSRHGASGRLTARQRLRRSAADALTAQGLNEIVGWSFAHPDVADRLRLGAEHPLRRTVALANPLSTDLSVLRTTLLGSLLDIARHNRARGVGNVRLFEAGAVYLPTEPGQLPREPYHVGALLTGTARPASWRDGHPPAVDFFAVKGVLEGLMDRLHADWRLEHGSSRFCTRAGPPGPRRRRASRLDRRDTPAGRGAVGPPRHRRRVRARPRRRARAGDRALPRGERLPRRARGHRGRRPRARDRGPAARAGPARWRPAARRRRGVRRVSRPERLGEGNVSLALRLTYRAGDRTLTDEEVAERRDAIAEAVAEKLGGRIRAS